MDAAVVIAERATEALKWVDGGALLVLDCGICI